MPASVGQLPHRMVVLQGQGLGGAGSGGQGPGGTGSRGAGSRVGRVQGAGSGGRVRGTGSRGQGWGDRLKPPYRQASSLKGVKFMGEL